MFLKVPSKENGLDIEGIAVQGERVWLGLRGPVLVGYAVVLELMLKQPRSGRLKPRRIGPGGRRYRKHLLDTGGLGIRDLRRSGQDLVLLVGPTMALEGTAHVLKWLGGVQDEAEGMVPTSRLELVADLPYRRQSDHPEGLELWPGAGDGALLVVYDAPGPEPGRHQPDGAGRHSSTWFRRRRPAEVSCGLGNPPGRQRRVVRQDDIVHRPAACIVRRWNGASQVAGVISVRRYLTRRRRRPWQD
ncbi:DUF3616 domain-containing protein [Falsiroseomonas sp. E2-1-a20]|uniref:DUF3616 domain-containing protein n=1 Tax=Falsiroseomonas sp. E2-1-a20 TaxID=3239300 RepID=UPI003F2A99E5